MSTLNGSYIETNINNISEKILKNTDGELVTAKYVLTFYLHMDYTQNSGRLRCNFRIVEPMG